MTPRISVVMPVHNARPYLAAALSSILKQSYQDFELIVIDDGSTDGSNQVIQMFALNDLRLRIVTQERRGVTAAIQTGVDLASGEFVARMDADDIADPNRFEIQVAWLDRFPETVALGSYIERIDNDGFPIAIGKWPVSHEEIDSQLLIGQGGLPHPAAMIRRRTLDLIGGYNLDYQVAQDKDLWLRMAERGRLENVPQPLLKYREHLGSISALRQKEQWESTVRAVHAACLRRGIPVPDELVRKQATFRPEQKTRFDQQHDWIRASTRSGNFGTAWKHTRSLLLHRPFAPQSWNALARLSVTPLWAGLRRFVRPSRDA